MLFSKSDFMCPRCGAAQNNFALKTTFKGGLQFWPVQQFAGCSKCGARLRLKSKLPNAELLAVQMGIFAALILAVVVFRDAGFVFGFTAVLGGLVATHVWSKTILNFFFEVEAL